MTEELKQADVLPAVSVAVALKVVVVSSLTVTVSPGEPKAVAVPVCAAEPLQSLDE